MIYMAKISDMRQKEVINIYDGRRFGFICDVEFSVEDGRVESIIVPSESKILGLVGRNEGLAIPWSCIKKIGNDIVLVDFG